jgi:hypothetical protein
MPAIPAFQRLRQEGLQVQGQPELHDLAPTPKKKKKVKGEKEGAQDSSEAQNSSYLKH